MEDALDDLLSAQPAKIHQRAKSLLEISREAYPIGVPVLLMKSHTDRLGAAAGHAFHLGTPDRELRRIASWMLTHAGEDQWELCRLVPLLWKRHGREDCVLAALLLANLRPPLEPVGSDAWAVLAGIIGRRESAETLLFAIEEFHRAKLAPPGEDVILRMLENHGAKGQFALLVLHSIWIRGGRFALTSEVGHAVESLPLQSGDSLLGRVRDQLLNSSS